jgi:hypothetical protein
MQILGQGRQVFLIQESMTMIHKFLGILIILTAFACPCVCVVRPPAVPLITNDPYLSVWSMDDYLSAGPTRHWTGKAQRLTGLVKIDGKSFRWMGDLPKAIPPIEQKRLEVTATRTIYEFEQNGIKIHVCFLSPLFPSDLDVMSRPISYLALDAVSVDNRTHQVEFLIDVADDLAVDHDTQEVVWSRSRLDGMSVLRASNFEQPVLQKSGDDVRIDWGSLLLAVPDQPGTTVVTQAGDTVEAAFVSGTLNPADDIDMPRRASERPVLAASFKLGDVSTTSIRRHVLLGYDDLYSIEYLNRRMRPYWRHDGTTIGQLLERAEKEYGELSERSRRFDDELLADLQRTGGSAYADVAILSFRQTLAAHKLVADVDGRPLLFPKENFSNGCISTVDVLYPSSPFFLLFNPELLKAQLVPLMEYTRTGRWRFPFAPHDLGTYPLANGQVYGGGEHTEENQMPVEESGNMLLMFAALAKAEGNAAFASHYWTELRQWAEYLRKEGLDPANQLSTDDFAGHLAHNANLSIKAILALAAYSKLAESTGHHTEAVDYRNLAENMAKRWMELAQDEGHYRLAFDKPGTWSQKYNLVWDRILGLNIFSTSVASTEIGFYKSHLKAFGLPLDNRKGYTKLDWEVWTATLTDSTQDFEILLQPLKNFIEHSPDRVPLTDWYWTEDGKQAGFQARSVVGGVYIPLLRNPDIWGKWSKKSMAVSSGSH